ncbi:MAG: DMT family transporter, partial [Chloroflexota bacterium]
MTDLAEPLPGVAPARIQVPARGYALYLTAAFLFAFNGTVAKSMLLAGMAASDLSQVRATGTFILLFAFVALTNRKALRIRRSELPLLVAYGVIGVAFVQHLYFVSIMTIPIGISLLIEFTAPLIIAVWFRFALHHPTKRVVWVALATALAGLAIVGEAWNGLTLDPLGVAAAFAAAAALAFYFVAADHQVRRPEPRDPVSLTMWGMGFAALFWAIVQPLWNFPVEAFGRSIGLFGDVGPIVPVIIPAAWMTVMGTTVPFSLTVLSMQHLRASQASVVGMIEPLFAIAIAWVLLGQVFSPVQIVGAEGAILGQAPVFNADMGIELNPRVLEAVGCGFQAAFYEDCSQGQNLRPISEGEVVDDDLRVRMPGLKVGDCGEVNEMVDGSVYRLGRVCNDGVTPLEVLIHEPD